MFFPLYDLNPHRRPATVTTTLIVINLLSLVWMQLATPEARFERTLQFGFVPARFAQMSRGEPVTIDVARWVRHEHLPLVAKVRQRYVLPANYRTVLLTLVSCMFLHAGWMHLIGNMWFLWLFGNNVEDRLGHGRYLVFYLLGGMIASMVHWYTNPQSTIPVVGASGAVSSVLGAYAVTWPHARIRTMIFLVVFITFWDLPALAVLGAWFVGQLAEAANARVLEMNGGVAWWAHVGGFVAGAIVMPLWSEAPRSKTWGPIEVDDVE